MRRPRPFTLLAVSVGFIAGAVGGAVAMVPGSAPAHQARGHDAHHGDSTAFHQPVPREFRAMLGQMKASNIEATVNKLVSFGTRQTLSSTDRPEPGDRRCARLHLQHPAGLRPGLRRADDGGEADVHPARVLRPE